jgi:phosphate-selective porin OprO/OprP
MWRKGVGGLVVGVAVVLVVAGPAAAQDRTLDDLKARLDKLEKQNEELRRKVGDVADTTAGPYKADTAEKEKVNTLVDAYLKEKDAKKKKEDEEKKKKEEFEKLAKEAEGFVVGSDLAIATRWNPAQGLLFETKNKDFVSHIGFFFQLDTVAFSQTSGTLPTTQLGDLQDGTFFRRVRPLWDGRAWDFVEWNVILALEQVQGSVSATTPAVGTTLSANVGSNINLDEVWAGVYGVPIIGRIRAGHLKVPQGLEGNQWSSSRAMTFMENAAYTDAFYNIFATGVQTCNSWLDDGCNGDRVTAQTSLYRDDNPRTNTGEDFGDGKYGATVRATALLYDAAEDREFLHVGVSATWRKSQETGLGTTGAPVTNFQARPELRDGIGGFGDGADFPGDTGRMVATGNIINSDQSVVGGELWYSVGPLSIMAEGAVATLYAAKPMVTVNGVSRQLGSTADRSFTGGYVTVSYFLTGENRAYDHTFGREYTFYLLRPFTNAWLVRGENGGVSAGIGAWEVAARYSFLNLNDGPIQGGAMDGLTLGLNWYLNNNMKIQFDYVHDTRTNKSQGLPANTFVTGGGGTVPGTVDGFGTRLQIQF